MLKLLSLANVDSIAIKKYEKAVPANEKQNNTLNGICSSIQFATGVKAFKDTIHVSWNIQC